METSQPHNGLLRDIFNGAVRGDFAAELGVAGALTQIILAYVPVIGTICAIRDYLADRQSGDSIGVWLNILAVVPFFGGFPKTAEVIEHAVHLGKMQHRLGHVGPRRQGAAGTARAAHSRASVALILALLIPLLIALLAVGVVAVGIPRLHLTSGQVLTVVLGIGSVVSLLVVVLARGERRRNRDAVRSSVHRAGMLGASVLGYLYLTLMVLIACVAVVAYTTGLLH